MKISFANYTGKRSFAELIIFENFKTEIILWLVFYAMYMPLSILIWLSTGRPTNITIAGVMTVGTICLGIFTLLQKTWLASRHLKPPHKKREVRHPEMERISVSSFKDNLPILGKSPQKAEEVKQDENETIADNLLDDEHDNPAPVSAS